MLCTFTPCSGARKCSLTGQGLPGRESGLGEAVQCFLEEHGFSGMHPSGSNTASWPLPESQKENADDPSMLRRSDLPECVDDLSVMTDFVKRCGFHGCRTYCCPHSIQSRWSFGEIGGGVGCREGGGVMGDKFPHSGIVVREELGGCVEAQGPRDHPRMLYEP